MESRFAFKDLEVYGAAVRFYAWAVPISDRLARTERVTADQLRRAALSIVLNVAEGSGLWRRGNKMKHYAYARGSTFEVAALLDVLLLGGRITRRQYETKEAELAAIGAMLTRLIQRYDGNHPGHPTPTPTPTPTRSP
jgi:four helix bundle protein